MPLYIDNLKKTRIYLYHPACFSMTKKEMPWPTVSVCVPTFNGSKYLAGCLESVLAQSFSSFEILVVDDGSNDNTAAIVEYYARTDHRIRFIQNSHNKGLVGNWNCCISLARGEWIKLQFQDDTMHPLCVELLFERAKTTGSRLVLCGREYRFDNAVPEYKRNFYEELPTLAEISFNGGRFSPNEVNNMVAKHFLGANFLGEPIAGLFHKSLVATYGLFDTRLRQICDFEYWCRIASCEGVAYEPRKLVTFTVHGGSASARNGKRESKFDRIILGYRLLHDTNYRAFRDQVDLQAYDLSHKYQIFFDNVFVNFGLLTTYCELENSGLKGKVFPSLHGWILYIRVLGERIRKKILSLL